MEEERKKLEDVYLRCRRIGSKGIDVCVCSDLTLYKGGQMDNRAEFIQRVTAKQIIYETSLSKSSRVRRIKTISELGLLGQIEESSLKTRIQYLR